MNLGFIGAGNMGSAMARGIITKGIASGSEVRAYDPFAENLERLHKELGIQAEDSNRSVVEKSDVLILAVKPQFYEDVITEIAPFVRAEQLVITIAPGKTLAWLRETFGKDVKLIRTMPNTPAMVGEGITGVCHNELVTEEELAEACSILNGFGISEVIPEHLMDAVVAVSGSSPAYVFIMIEAMADAAVAEGMPRKQAYRFAAQAVLGSAKMVLETGKHPAELKDMVCSPAGTTIDAVKVLEELGFRSAIEEAMAVCAEKCRRV